MKMYTLADKAIAPEEFSRAVTICTGRNLSPYVVKTVFQVRIWTRLLELNLAFFTKTYFSRYLTMMAMECLVIKNSLP